MPSRLLVLIITLILAGCSKPVSILEQVKNEGTLRVITRNSPTTYYEGPQGPTGFDYDLVSAFAEHLGVKLEIITPDRFDDLLPAVARRKVHMAAAGLTVTNKRKRFVRFTIPYQRITQQIIYSKHQRRPKNIDALSSGTLEVMASSSHVERLRELKKEHRSLQWTENSSLESDQLMFLVKERLIDFTVADSNEAAINRRFYPDLRVAFEISTPQPLAWAFPRDRDRSLFVAADEFIATATESGLIDQLTERHYGHTERFDYVDLRAFRRHILSRLPKYQAFFKAAALEYKIDWRLLAAIGYQESHWNPKAVSPTGVRGIMMLTQPTARQMGVTKRTDAEQSIQGGTKYFARIRNRLPDSIKDPDRSWMALASYNVGYGHVLDARKITRQRNGSPDKWIDIKQTLPLLSQKKWYKSTRHGYARGREPVQYVQNIRSYYDILVWLDHSRLSPPLLITPQSALSNSASRDR